MIIFGKQVVLYALEKHKEKVETIILSKELDKKLFDKLAKSGKKIEKCDNKKAQALAKGGNHQGMLAKIEPLSFWDNKLAKNYSFVVACVGVTDSGNLGAIIRSAWALGVEALVLSGIKSANLEAIIRTSSGAVLDMPIFLIPNAFDMIEEFKQAGFFTIGATLNGKNLHQIKLDQQKKLLILGSEDEGLPNRLISKLHQQVTIPMKKGFDSLNVSAAAAILIDRIGQ